MDSCNKHDRCIVVYDSRDCPVCSLDDEIKMLKERVETLDNQIDRMDEEIVAFNEQVDGG